MKTYLLSALHGTWFGTPGLQPSDQDDFAEVQKGKANNSKTRKSQQRYKIGKLESKSFDKGCLWLSQLVTGLIIVGTEK